MTFLEKHLRPWREALACLCILSGLSTGLGAPPATEALAPGKPGDARRGDFIERHQAFLQRAKDGPIGILFLGDSITERWKIAPNIWAAYYVRYQPANFGIGGDTTQGVLWRIANGELGKIHPRVVVFLLGTNNVSQGYSAREIAEADKKIVGLIRGKLPDAKVLLLGLFPRGPRRSSDGTFDDGPRHMPVIRAVNAELSSLDDGRNIRFLDIGARFLGADGKIPDPIMADQLHPTAAGYQIWAEAMQPLLSEMLR